MKLALYSVYDSKTQIFLPPMCFHNDEHAMRDMRLQLERGDTVMSKFPADYELRCVGDWDDHSGELEAVSPSRLVCRVDSLSERDTEAA